MESVLKRQMPKDRTYTKPELRRIPLKADEVLSVGCKMSTPPGAPLGATCTAAACFSAGS